MTTSMTATADSALNVPLRLTFPRFLKGPLCWYRRRRDLREARDAFLHMVYLDDRRLDDAGVTRGEVSWAASLPLEVNAALALQARSALRRSQQR